MSFRCDQCGKISDPGKKPVSVVTEKREKEYPNQTKKGWEIVREEDLCQDCAPEPVAI